MEALPPALRSRAILSAVLHRPFITPGTPIPPPRPSPNPPPPKPSPNEVPISGESISNDGTEIGEDVLEVIAVLGLDEGFDGFCLTLCTKVFFSTTAFDSPCVAATTSSISSSLKLLIAQIPRIKKMSPTIAAEMPNETPLLRA